MTACILGGMPLPQPPKEQSGAALLNLGTSYGHLPSSVWSFAASPWPHRSLNYRGAPEGEPHPNP